MKPKLTVILGPTASGKTDFGIKLAREKNGAVVSADSRQVYAGMNIGTAKPEAAWSESAHGTLVAESIPPPSPPSKGGETPLLTKSLSRTRYGKGRGEVSCLVYPERSRGAGFTDLACIDHFLFNITTPDDPMTLSEWQSAAFSAIDHIIAQGKHPILVGGTMLYIDSVVYNYDIPNVPPNLELRAKLERLDAGSGPGMTTRGRLSPQTCLPAEALAKAGSGVQKIQGKEIRSPDSNQESKTKKLDAGSGPGMTMSGHVQSPLWQELMKKDPAAAKFIQPHNTRRIIRALEVIEATGKPFSALRKKREPRYDCKLIGLFSGWEELRKRITKRAALMMKEGLLEEMKALRNQYGNDLPLLQTMNYKQAGMVIDGKMTKQEAIEEMTRVNMRYAHRQMSWWKNKKRIDWI